MRPIKELDSMSVEEQEELAFDKLMKSVNIREQSSLKMRRKLSECGFSENVIDEVLCRAYEISAIDDLRYCECLIRTTLSSGKGLSQVEREIEQLGIDPMDLESYRIYLEEGEDPQIEMCLEILNRHPPRSKNIRDGAFRKLVSKGFSPSVAAKVSNIYFDALKTAV